MTLRRASLVALIAALALAGCERPGPPKPTPRPAGQGNRVISPVPAPLPPPEPPRNFKAVHVFVALCDNANQGIVRVPEALGNGQDPHGNLYWGAKYGVKTFFKGSADWRLVDAWKGKAPVLRCALFHGRFRGRSVYVFAEAWDGAKMRETLEAFLAAAAGRSRRRVLFGDDGRKIALPVGGGSDLVCFVGHNGLMDMRLERYPSAAGDHRPEAAVVLACKSRDYFTDPLTEAGCKPLVTTTGLMAPEAYTLDAVIRSWASGETPAQTRAAAAAAYTRYQGCFLPAARRLFGAE